MKKRVHYTYSTSIKMRVNVFTSDRPRVFIMCLHLIFHLFNMCVHMIFPVFHKHVFTPDLLRV